MMNAQIKTNFAYHFDREHLKIFWAEIHKEMLLNLRTQFYILSAIEKLILEFAYSAKLAVSFQIKINITAEL
jgi:hypothetical protein